MTSTPKLVRAYPYLIGTLQGHQNLALEATKKAHVVGILTIGSSIEVLNLSTEVSTPYQLESHVYSLIGPQEIEIPVHDEIRSQHAALVKTIHRKHSYEDIVYRQRSSSGIVCTECLSNQAICSFLQTILHINPCPPPAT